MDFSQSYWHLAVFAALFLAGLGLVIWQAAEEYSSVALATNVIREMDSVVVVSAAVAILSVDGTKMFAESFLKKRYEDGRRDGRKDGRKSVLNDLVERQIITEEQRRAFEELAREPK